MKKTSISILENTNYVLSDTFCEDELTYCTTKTLDIPEALWKNTSAKSAAMMLPLKNEIPLEITDKL